MSEECADYLTNQHIFDSNGLQSNYTGLSST